MKRLPAKLISCVLAAVLCLSVLSAEADYLTVIHSPESKSCASGETAQFMCAATGDGVTYRWQARSAADQAWTETSFAGHDGQILFVPAGNETDGWQFRCVISDAGGSSAATVPASLTVTAGKSAAVQPSAPAAGQAVEADPVQAHASAAGQAETAKAAAKSVTVMLYMNGSDLESDDGSASDDLAEILRAGAGKNVNIIVETIGTSRWHNYGISPSTAQRWRVNGSKLELVKDRLGRISVAEAEPLADFISWTAKEYPADRYILLLWNHGGGAVYGYGSDDWVKNSEDALTMDEMQQALNANPDIRFDIIGMDACLMGSLEVCVALAPYCNYTILSEDFESGIGWYYTDWIRALEANPALPTPVLGKTIVDTMIAVNKTDRNGDESTLALIDESKVEALFTAWMKFAYANEKALLGSNYSTQRRSRGRGQAGRPWSYSGGFGSMMEEDVELSTYYVTDMMSVASNAPAADVAELEATLGTALVYTDSSSSDGLTGLGITLPYGDPDFYRDLKEIFTACGLDGNYIEWLEKFVSAQGSENYYDYNDWDSSWHGWGDWYDDCGWDDDSSSMLYDDDYFGSDWYEDFDWTEDYDWYDLFSWFAGPEYGDDWYYGDDSDDAGWYDDDSYYGGWFY